MEFIEGREGVRKGGDSEWEGRRKERRTLCFLLSGSYQVQGGKKYEIFNYPSVFVIMKPIKNVPYSLEDMKLRPKERGIYKDRGRIN